MIPVKGFEIWYKGEKRGEAADLLETEKLIEQLEKKLKAKADEMVIKTIYADDEQVEAICSKANPIDFQQAWEKFWTDGVEQDESA